MDAGVWKHLPADLHTHILKCCSVPDLCRFRVVCKAWNELTHDREFALKARPKDKYILKAPTAYKPGLGKTDAEVQNPLRNCWEIFDPSRQLFWSISIGSPYERMAPRNQSSKCQTIAADKGFVCVLWSSPAASGMQVVNPVTSSVIAIPPFPAFSDGRIFKAGAMCVAEDYSSFTLYAAWVIGRSENYLERFDSREGVWQEISLPEKLLSSSQMPPQNRRWYALGRRLFMLHMNEMLYMLWGTTVGQEYQYHLFTLDIVRGTWMDVGVELYKNVRMAHLAMALGRLFLVENYSLIVVFELNVASGQSSLVTTIDERDENHELLDCHKRGKIVQITNENEAVLGFDYYIILTSCTGVFIAYDLLKKEWSNWSLDRSKVDMLKSMNHKPYGVFAAVMILTLNLVPRPHVPLPHVPNHTSSASQASC